MKFEVTINLTVQQSSEILKKLDAIQRSIRTILADIHDVEADVAQLTTVAESAEYRELITDFETGEAVLPKYVWAVKNHGVREAQIEDLLEPIICDMDEDADESDLARRRRTSKGRRRLQ